MDLDHNSDSDTSEGWSVIDINDNEHANVAALYDGFGSHIVPVNYEWSTSDTNIDDENSGVDLHSQQSKNAVQDLSNLNCPDNSQNTASTSKEHSKDHQDFQVLYKGKLFQNDHSLRKESSEYNCSKSSFSEAEKVEVDNKLKVSISDFENDTDCISIISESEWNDLKVNAYETDEILEEKLSKSNTQEKTYPNVLKRKRKRLKLNYRESSEESVSSDFMVPDAKYYSNIQNIDYKKSNNEMQVKEYQSTPVYRHYRNNVANTVLTLAMGVIFTGVACIAVGHFLGVHDAQHTAGEMMETLKRLQMENVLLHTRLAQLSRAFFSRGNSKLEMRANVDPQNCLDKYLEENIRGINENNLNNESPIKNSIFFRGGSFDISTNTKEPQNELNYQESRNWEKKTKVLDENHDESNFFNISKYEERYSKSPYSSTTPVKASDIYNKGLLGKNLGGVKENILRNRPKGDRIIWKSSAGNENCIRADEQYEIGHDKEDSLAIREKDLSRFRWFLLQKKKKRRNMKFDEGKSTNEAGDGVYVYRFPQPEGFYKYEGGNENERRSGNKFKLEEMCDELKLVRYPKVKDPSDANNSTQSSEKEERKDDKSKEKRHSLKMKKEKKRGKDKNEEDKDLDDVKSSDSMKKREKFQKKNPSKKLTKDYEDNISKGSKKYKTESSKKNGKMKECRKKGDRECYFKPHSKKNRDATKEKNREEERKGGKENEKYLKGEKVKKMKLGKETQRPRLHKNRRNFRGKKTLIFEPEMKFINESECEGCGGNRTAGWLYKWAKGREKCRREQKISDWQFDRAKSRAASRIGDAYWQFSRALARESSRNEAYMHFRKRDKYSQHKGFSDAYSWI